MAFVTAIAQAVKTIEEASQAATTLAGILRHSGDPSVSESLRFLLNTMADYWRKKLQELGVAVPDDELEVEALGTRFREALRGLGGATAADGDGSVIAASRAQPSGPSAQECLQVLGDAERLKPGSTFVQKMRTVMNDRGCLTQNQLDALKRIIGGDRSARPDLPTGSWNSMLNPGTGIMPPPTAPGRERVDFCEPEQSGGAHPAPFVEDDLPF